MDKQQVEEIEREIRALVGVESARIRLDAQEEIAAVHILAGAGRRPRQVARDVMTTVYARLGIELARRQIHVAAMRSLELAREVEEAPRIQFKSVNVFRENQRVEAQVELIRGDRVLIGTAAGPAVRKSLPRLVGRATLGAIGQLAPHGVAWELLEVERRRIGERAAILCHLALLQGRRETHLVGTVFQVGDVLEATVLSVLDATNRLLPVLEGEDAIEYEVEPFTARLRG